MEVAAAEPLLRLDLVSRVRDFYRERLGSVEFVVCTNLQNVSEEAWGFLAAPDNYFENAGYASVKTSKVLEGVLGRHRGRSGRRQPRI